MPKKKYFQVLLDLKRALEKNPSIRSDQTGSYYDVIRAGHTAVLGLKDADYKMHWKCIADGVDFEASGVIV